jgi:hypothetical protein
MPPTQGNVFDQASNRHDITVDELISGDIGSAGGDTGLFPSTLSLDQNEH